MSNKGKRFLGAIFLMLTIFNTIAPVANAASYDYKSSHTVTDSFGTKVTKSARWTDEETREAEITITVETQKKDKEEISKKNVSNADIIYLLDKSWSMGDENKAKTTYAKVRNAVSENLNYFMTGEYADSKNRVAYASFSSNVYLYNANGRTRVCYNKPYGDKLTSTNALNYLQAKERMFGNFSEVTSARFETTEAGIRNLRRGLEEHGFGENTNYDLPLFYAQYLLENRSEEDKNRQTYIICITEGEPFPTDNDQRGYQARKNPTTRNSDYLANKFYKTIAEDLRNTYNAKIYAILFDRNIDNPIYWKDITGYQGVVPKNYEEENASGPLKCPIMYITDEEDAAISQIHSLHDAISADINWQYQQTVTKVEVDEELTATITDEIDTNLFEIVSQDPKASCETNIGTVSVDGDKVTWKISGIDYGELCSDGKYPTLTIKVRLKDTIDKQYIRIYNGKNYVNTNNIHPEDEGCEYTDELPDPDPEPTPVPTPWLELDEYKVTEKWINEVTGEVLDTKGPSEVVERTQHTFDGIKDYSSKNLKYTHSTIQIGDKKEEWASDKRTLTVKDDMILTHYYIPNYNVTERWVNETTGEIIEVKGPTNVAKGVQYTFDGIKDYSSRNLEYTRSTIQVGNANRAWTQNDKTITVNDATVVTHYYYMPSYTVTEKWVNETAGEIIEIKGPTNVAKGVQYTFDGIKDYSSRNLEYTRSTIQIGSTNREWTQNDKTITVNDNTIVTHYYEKLPNKYTVTIKYIDDENNEKIILKKAKSNIEEGTIFPGTTTIAREYLVEGDNEIVGQFGRNYMGYKLVSDNIIIDGKQYNANNMLKTIVINKDIEIEFHYRLKDAEFVKRVFYIKEVDGKTSLPELVKVEGPEAIKMYQQKNVSKVNLPSNYKGEYIGHNVTNDSIVTSHTLENLIPKDKATVTGTPKKTYVDFFYKEVYYTLTIRYEDMQGVELKNPVIKTYPAGTVVTPDVPDMIEFGDFEYNYKERSDRQPQPARIVVDGTKEVIMKYDKAVLAVTVKYIDDETGEIIQQKDYTNVIKNTNYPSNSTIAREHKIDGKDIVGTWGTKYNGYELDTTKIIVDGTKYEVNQMPNTIYIDKNKEIEFHYKLKDAEVIKRIIYVVETEGVNKLVQTIDVEKFKDMAQSEKIKIAKDHTVNKLNLPAGHEGTYIGNNTSLQPMILSTVLENLDEEETAKVNIPAANENEPQITTAYANFFYKVNTLTIKYQDQNGNDILDPIVEEYPVNEEVIPDVPGKIEKNGIEYEYVERTDEKAKDESIIVDKAKTVIIKYESTTVPVEINFIDKITGEPITTPQKEQASIGETVEVDYDRVPDEYKYLSRDDGKPSESTPVGQIEGPTIVNLYYRWDDPINPPPGGGGQPVVSYPDIEMPHSKNGKDFVIVGEKIKVNIPSDGYHKQMEDLGEIEPDEGWNGRYAQVKYLEADCDLYYNKQLYSNNPSEIAGAKPYPIKLANPKERTEEILMVPEWVKEGEYDINVIIGSRNNNLEDLKHAEPDVRSWNKLYDETAAIGTVKVNVVGKVYDFTITNLADDTNAKMELFNVEKEYKARIAQTNPEIGTLPIGQGIPEQQQEKYNHGIALGSRFTFSINTLGRKNEAISIKPKFAFVPKGSNIVNENITLYSRNGTAYEEIKEGQAVQMQAKLNNELYKENTKLELEMTTAWRIGGFKDLETNYMHSIGNYSRLLLNKNHYRTPFVDYFIETGKEYDSQEEKDLALESACHWYGEYGLPSSTIVMEKGKAPGEGKEYKDGFIIVMFEIVTRNTINESAHNDNQYLIYQNQYVGDQWKNEGGKGQGEKIELTMPRLTAGVAGTKVYLDVKDGYYPVAIYDASVRANGNYEIAGTH